MFVTHERNMKGNLLFRTLDTAYAQVEREGWL